GRARRGPVHERADHRAAATGRHAARRATAAGASDQEARQTDRRGRSASPEGPQVSEPGPRSGHESRRAEATMIEPGPRSGHESRRAEATMPRALAVAVVFAAATASAA